MGIISVHLDLSLCILIHDPDREFHHAYDLDLVDSQTARVVPPCATSCAAPGGGARLSIPETCEIRLLLTTPVTFSQSEYFFEVPQGTDPSTPIVAVSIQADEFFWTLTASGDFTSYDEEIWTAREIDDPVGTVFTFAMTAEDGYTSAAATIHITVTGSQDPPPGPPEFVSDDGVPAPTVSNDNYTFAYPALGTIVAEDPEEDMLFYSIVGQEYSIVTEGDVWQNFTTGNPFYVDGTGEIRYHGVAEFVPGATYVFTAQVEDLPASGSLPQLDTTQVRITVPDAPPAPPIAVDDTFEYPEPGDEYVDIDVLANDSPSNGGNNSLGDQLTIESVTIPSDGGTAEIITDPTDGRQRIRYRPPASYNSDDPTVDNFSVGTLFTYTVADSGGTNDAFVQAGRRTWTPWREYSRGNDDPRENIYETGKIKVELVVDLDQKKIRLRYTGTSTTSSMLRWRDNPDDDFPWPVLQNVTNNPDAPGAMPEYEIYQPFLFLQPAAGAGAVPANPAGTGLGFNNGVLSAEIEVASWDEDPTTLAGTAVVQMRVYEIFYEGQWRQIITDPDWWANDPVAIDLREDHPNRDVYGPVRQEIPWNVRFETVNGILLPKGATLDVNEITLNVYGTQGQVVTPLRNIDSSNGEANVDKVGYPPHPGVARMDYVPDNPAFRETLGAQDNPFTPGDQRAEPVTPIPDWDVKVKAKTK